MFRFRPVRILGTILALCIGCLATLGLRPEAAQPAIPVKVQDVQTSGALAAAAVRRVLVAESARLARGCQDAVKNGYQLPAEITLVFKVGTDGQVMGEPLGKPPLASQGFETCLAQALKDLQFPKTKKVPAQVTVKLALRAKETPTF
jgi:hypothetical protein